MAVGFNELSARSKRIARLRVPSLGESFPLFPGRRTATAAAPTAVLRVTAQNTAYKTARLGVHVGLPRLKFALPLVSCAAKKCRPITRTYTSGVIIVMCFMHLDLYSATAAVDEPAAGSSAPEGGTSSLL